MSKPFDGQTMCLSAPLTPEMLEAALEAVSKQGGMPREMSQQDYDFYLYCMSKLSKNE